MFRQAGILFALIVSVASLRIIQEPEIQGREEQLPGYRRGTRDQIVFDKDVWTPNCDESLQFEQQPFDMDACREFEQSRSLKYKDREERSNSASSSKTAKIMVFLHISKSGGTLACDCGKASGETTKGDNMCHALPEDFAWWGNQSIHSQEFHPTSRIVESGFATHPIVHQDDCDLYKEALARQDVTMEHNENFLPREGKLCDNTENIIIVRDPIQRIASHVSYLTGGTLALNTTLAEINAHFPRLADNYLARSLAGSSAFQAEFGALPESTGEKSMQTLKKFDNIFIMDDSLNSELEHHYGWSCDAIQGKVSSISSSGGTPAIVEYWKKTWPKEDWESLLNQHKFDLKLFDLAKYLSFQKSFLRYNERFSGSPLEGASEFSRAAAREYPPGRQYSHSFDLYKNRYNLS